MFICQPLQDELGETPLCVACAKGQLNVACLLLQNGAFVNYETKVRIFYQLSSPPPERPGDEANGWYGKSKILGFSSVFMKLKRLHSETP